MKKLGERTLSGGETLSVEYFEPGEQEAPGVVEEITNFVIQAEDLDSWTSVAESLYLKGCLRGDFCETSLDPFFLGRIEGEVVGDVGCQVARDQAELGSLGWVFTKPEQRGKGISSCLTEFAVQWFDRRGGLCMQLGTANPIAHHLYEKYGFRDYNGHVMRRLSGGTEAEKFDEFLFAASGRPVVRRAEWGDASRVAALYAAPHPWLIQDHRESLFSHPTLVTRRYFSIFPSLMLRAERPGSLYVQECPGNRLVGVAAVLPQEGECQAHVGCLDFLIRPNHLGRARELVQRVLEEAVRGGITTVLAYFASCDQEKMELAEKAGLRPVATLPDHFRAGEARFDLRIYHSELARKQDPKSEGPNPQRTTAS